MDGTGSMTARSWLLAFTGLIPLALTIPILLLHLYAVGIIGGLVAGAGVIAYHLARKQGVTSVDLLTIGFGALNAVLYFGFDDRTIIENLDVAIYTLLTALIVLSLIRRQPWTAQFARRMVPAELWDQPLFHTINMRTTALWAVAFAACDVLALVASGPPRRYTPIVIVMLTAAAVPRLVRWSRARAQTLALAGAGRPTPADG